MERLPILPEVAFCVLAAVSNSELRAAAYTFTDLGTGSAAAINNSGVVAVNDTSKAFKVADGMRTEVRVNTGCDSCWATNVTATAVNAAGHVVGVSQMDGYRNAFFHDGLTNSWVPVSVATGVNNLDTIVGYGYDPVVRYNYAWVNKSPLLHPFDGEIINQDDTGQYVGTELYDITDTGILVGAASFREGLDPTKTASRAIKIDQGKFIYLDTRPRVPEAGQEEHMSVAFAVNASGHAVGVTSDVVGSPEHAFRHVGAGMEDLGTLGGATSRALDINDSDWIVGQSAVTDGARRAFVWHDGQMIDLNSLVLAGLGFTLVSANSINNAGQIVGSATLDGNPGVIHAFLLSPEGLSLAPVVRRQPEGASAPLGGSVTLRVLADGTPPLSYSWLHGQDAVNGVTTPTLELTNLTSLDAGEYRAVVTNASGRTVSQPALVNVLDPELKAYRLFGMTVEGAVGAKYRIDFKASANAANWEPLETITLTNKLQWWVDFESPNYPLRIYRAVRLP